MPLPYPIHVLKIVHAIIFHFYVDSFPSLLFCCFGILELGLVLKMNKFVFLMVHMTLFVAAIFLSFLIACESLRSPPDIHMDLNDRVRLHVQKNYVIPKERVQEEPRMEIYPTGSSLPDCSHACGPCFPCKRVMVSFQCSIAESCPIVYRCMCKGRYFHVPSN